MITHESVDRVFVAIANEEGEIESERLYLAAIQIYIDPP